MGALAAIRKEIPRTEIDAFVKKRGMPGFFSHSGPCSGSRAVSRSCPRRHEEGKDKEHHVRGEREPLLGRMSQLSDGLSFLLEANPAVKRKAHV